MIHIQRLSSLDLRALEPLRLESVAEGYSHLEGLVSRYTEGARDFEAPGAFVFGCYDGVRLVGIGGITPDPYAPVRAGRVRRVYVLFAYRGQGIGRRLVEAILEEGQKEYDLFTLRAANSDAARLYERLGFVRSQLPETTHELRAHGCSPAKS